MNIKDYIERGKELIADWQWAYYACADSKLAQKYCEERQKLEAEVMSKGEDFAYEYFKGIYE